MLNKKTVTNFIYFLLIFLTTLTFGNNVSSLASISEIYEAKEHDKQILNIAEIVKGNGFIKITESTINKNNSVHWLRFNLQNNEAAQVEKYISFGYTNEEITLYQIIGNQIIKTYRTGLIVTNEKKSAINPRTEFIKILLPANSSSLFLLKIHNEGIFSKQLFAYSTKDFNLYDTEAYFYTFGRIRDINLLFYGAMMVLLLYTTFLSFSIRSRAYMYFSFYILLFSAFNFATDGFLFVDFEGKSGLYFKMLRFLIAPLMTIAYAQFSRVYIDTEKLFPKLDKYILISMLLTMLSYVFFMRSLWAVGRIYLFASIVLSMSMIFYVSIIYAKKKTLPAKYFFFGTTIIFLTCVIYVAYLTSIIPHVPSTKYIEYIIQLSSIFVIGVFCVGLSTRIKSLERDIAIQKIQSENERKELIEEKGMELKYKILESTRELRKQRDEISAMNAQLEEKVKERTKKLQKAYRDLLNLNYELDSFIYRAAHDIRGPITTIMGLCNIALLEKDFGKCQEYLMILDKYSKSTQATLNRILGVNDLKNNPLHRTAFDLQDLTESVSALLIANPDRIKVNIQYQLPLNTEIYTDYNLLQTTIQNLIDNSIRFRTTNKNEKPFCKTIIEKAEDELVITILDNGDGIDEKIKDKVFDMFFRGSEYASGSGLGLYIAKIATKRLGGDVKLISSRVGETIFEITLPILLDKTQLKLAEMALKTPIN